MGAIDAFFDDPAQAVGEAQLVILCTPVGEFERILQAIAPALKPGAMVTDVGSTKRSVVAAAQRLLPASVHFVGSHPMAGSEKRGVEFARADFFANAACLITPTPQTDPAALEGVEGFWKELGMRIVRLSPAEHDRLLAEMSHLPHALAAALVTMQEAQGLALAGKGFLDTTRIAAGDGGIWRDILWDNRDNLRGAIQRLREELSQVEKMLEMQQGAALAQWLDAAALRRRELLERKLAEMNPD
jgi:prephenate dehydrogenase